MSRKAFCLLTFLSFSISLFPDLALAATGGLAEFAGPLEKMLATIRGPILAVILVAMVVIAAVAYWWKRDEDMSGMMKTLMGLIFVMTVAVCADALVNWLFPSVTGALI